MKVATRGKKWEFATYIYKTVGNREFMYSELGPEMENKQNSLRSMLETKIVIRTKKKTWSTPALYRLSDEIIDMLLRFAE